LLWAEKWISEEEDEVKYFVPSSTLVGCGCFEVVVDSHRFVATTSEMLTGWLFQMLLFSA